MFKKRVLMFGWEYAPYYSGGLGVVTKSIVESLRRQGMEVVFVLPKIPQGMKNEFTHLVNASELIIDEIRENVIESDDFIETIITPYMTSAEYDRTLGKTLEYIRKTLNLMKSGTGDLYGRNLIDEVNRYSVIAAEIARKYPHQIIHTHDWMTANAGVVAKRQSGKPLVMHVHATEYDRTAGNPNQQVYDIERNGMEKSDCIIAVSELTKMKIVQYYGIKADKIKVVHNAIDKIENAHEIDNKIGKSDKIILFLGRMTIQKGAEYLLEAAAKVLEHKKKVKFVFVGQGDMLEYLIKRSIQLGIQKKVIFTGFMSHDEVDRAYKMADLYVMPSVSEPFGITALEAINNGTPVLVSKQSGVSEVIRNALKVDFWDVEEIANKILAVIKYNPLSKFIAKNAEDELHKIDWNGQTKKIIEIYNQI